MSFKVLEERVVSGVEQEWSGEGEVVVKVRGDETELFVRNVPVTKLALVVSHVVACMAHILGQEATVKALLSAVKNGLTAAGEVENGKKC